MLLVRWSGQPSFILGVRTAPVFGIPLIMDAPFLPISRMLGEDQTFDELVAISQKALRDASKTPGVRFEQLLGRADGQRELARHPVYQAGFAVETQVPARWTSGRLGVELVEAKRTRYATLDINLTVAAPSGAVTASLEFAADLFEPEMMVRLAAQFTTALDRALREPSSPALTLPLIDPADEELVVRTWNQTSNPYPTEACTHDLIVERVRAQPDAIAIVFEDRRVSYAELDALSNGLARRLVALGVGPDHIVGVCAERSVNMVVALFGILKAGAAYLPLDPDAPDERLKFMLDDAKVQVLVTQGNCDVRLAAFSGTRIHLDDLNASSFTNASIAPRAKSSDLAYVIYTSGSTGRPKGVMTSHRSLVNRLVWMQRAFGMTPRDRVLQKTTFAFDVSVWEFFWPLMAGGCLVLAKPGGHRDPEYLVDLMDRRAVTIVHFVPSALASLVRLIGPKLPASLRLLIASGEALPATLAGAVALHNQLEFWNLYGPTEASIDVTSHQVTAGDSVIVPIGRPISNTQLLILDAWANPVPIGMAGELYISGDGLARGYINRPEMMAERFVSNPFGYSERMYRTGDLARWRPDGEIEYLGRMDDQVKVRGHRIELGEIEAALVETGRVDQAHVMAVDDLTGGRRLVAYVTCVGLEQLNKDWLRRDLKARLPDYMIPSQFISLASMPMNANGKIDRRRLPAPDEDVAPETPLVRPLQAALTSILHTTCSLDSAPMSAHFLDLIPDSLSALKVVRLLKRDLCLDVSVADLLTAPDLAAFVRCLSQAVDFDAGATADSGGAHSDDEGVI